MADPPSPPRLIRFGVFEVDLRSGELHKNGLKIKLQEQPFQVLSMLLEHPGEVVQREDLRATLWPADTFVDFEHGLNAAINKLREALGDSADNPRFVETLHRRGYRFIYPIDVGEHPRGAPALLETPRGGRKGPPLPRRWAIAIGVLGSLFVAVLLALNVAGLRDRLWPKPLPEIHSIAVLPLENLSGDPEQEYFADGLTEELITTLGKIGALRVISRTSAMYYKGTKKRLPEIAKELNVDAIVEGTVQRSGGRVRITANLLHAASDRHLWAESYERDLRDVLTLQGEVARAIADEIKANVTPDVQARLASPRRVAPEAHELYLKGRYFWNKRTPEAVKKSLDYFGQAVKKDPDSALSYAGLADSYIILGTYEYLPPKEAYPKAEAAAQRALEIDPMLAEAHTSLGKIRIDFDWDASASEEEYKRAIQLNPNYATAHHWYADLLGWVGRRDGSLVEIERARQLDPLSLIINSDVGLSLSAAHRYDEAIRQFHRTLEIDPNFALAHSHLAHAYVRRGRLPEAVAEAQRAVSLGGGASILMADLARVYAVAGNRQAAHELLKEISSRSYVPKCHVALVHVALGEHEQALDWLEKAFEDR